VQNGARFTGQRYPGLKRDDNLLGIISRCYSDRVSGTCGVHRLLNGRVLSRHETIRREHRTELANVEEQSCKVMQFKKVHGVKSCEFAFTPLREIPLPKRTPELMKFRGEIDSNAIAAADETQNS
jgi:hypothetical protein